MSLQIAVMVAIVAYLIGAVSFARIITRLVANRDIAEAEVAVDDGSGTTHKVLSIGGNSVSGMLGKKYGMLVSLLDVLKIVLPMLALKYGYPGQQYFLIAGLAGMAGHIWPIYYHFRGGSGWSTAIGAILVVDWLGVLVCPVAGFILGMFLVRNISVAIISWLWLLIPWLWFRTHNPAYVYFAIGLNILFILAMIPQIRIMLKYRKEGKLIEYGRGELQSNPMGRGFIKMAKFLGVEIR